ncbi:uncharacterized protein LOC113797361 isoform X1 [Dermatophagoides pteronyssinus]|uniref:Uncharacterized protein LOC113797361 n=1 Tax=Dermatophagoides pteronyssinus TaxID=6956 RepID=A0A6P6YDJ8_DERPT|nr:uncharacterized protein LOC113797361 [Dermatophagoides pteronyssinus]
MKGFVFVTIVLAMSLFTAIYAQTELPPCPDAESIFDIIKKTMKMTFKFGKDAVEYVDCMRKHASAWCVSEIIATEGFSTTTCDEKSLKICGQLFREPFNPTI